MSEKNVVAKLSSTQIKKITLEAKGILDSANKMDKQVTLDKNALGKRCYEFVHTTMNEETRKGIKATLGMSYTAWLEDAFGKDGKNRINSAASDYKTRVLGINAKKCGAAPKSARAKNIDARNRAIATLIEKGFGGVELDDISKIIKGAQAEVGRRKSAKVTRGTNDVSIATASN